MTAYRDGFESCPRCGVALEDAGSARACAQCRGLWVEHAVVTEMIQNMLSPGELGRLVLAVVERAERLACPSCRDPMDPTTIHQVILDACGKGHGVWFDAQELETTLQAVAALGSPLVPLDEVPRPTRPTPVDTGNEAHADLPVIYLREIVPRDALAQRFRQPVIKIGKVPSAHFKVVHDSVSRLHALIEVTRERLRIIDLGSTAGTLVDGDKVNVADLHDKARIQVGDVVLELRIEAGIDG